MLYLESPLHRYYCDYCDTYLTHDSVRTSILCVLHRFYVYPPSIHASMHPLAFGEEDAQLWPQAQRQREALLHELAGAASADYDDTIT